jgi:hypothetical protein
MATITVLILIEAAPAAGLRPPPSIGHPFIPFVTQYGFKATFLLLLA